MKKVIIIGAGFSGLASAALLGKEGFDVTVLEKNSVIGGRAMVTKNKGFSFDMGPSWYLMPDVFERFFAIFGKKPTDYFELVPLDPMYRVFFENKSPVDIKKTFKENKNTFEKFEKGSWDKIKEYTHLSRRQYDIALNSFLYKNVRPIDLLNMDTLMSLKILKPFTSIEKHVESYTKNADIKKLLSYSMLFLGGDPSRTPATYSLMTHADYGLGVFYPNGGFGSIIDALRKLCDENSVEIKTGITVKRITESYVETSKETFEADTIISSADYHHTETKLLDAENQSYPQSYWDQKDIAPSAFIMHLGLNKKLKNVDHHNLLMSDDWDGHFESIFKTKTWPDKPSMYVCVPSKTDKSVAPNGKETMFVLVPVASGLNDSDAKRKAFADKILDIFCKETGNTISDNDIDVQMLFSHREFKKQYNAYEGTMLGLSHTLFQTAFFRPSIKSKKLSNLFYTGQYTQPGIGVPMCLISAEIVTKEVMKNHE